MVDDVTDCWLHDSLSVANLWCCHRAYQSETMWGRSYSRVVSNEWSDSLRWAHISINHWGQCLCSVSTSKISSRNMATQTSGSLPQMECGSELLRSKFGFDPTYRNLNHGEQHSIDLRRSRSTQSRYFWIVKISSPPHMSLKWTTEIFSAKPQSYDAWLDLTLRYLQVLSELSLLMSRRHFGRVRTTAKLDRMLTFDINIPKN